MSKLVHDLLAFRTNISECPHPTKKRFKTEAAAQRRADTLGLEIYECVCGMWHMTGQCTREPSCPICGAPIDEYTDCGCYAEIMWGGD